MKAKILPGYDKNRQKLAEIVPLAAPFTLFIASTHVCNFRCFYCTHSKSSAEKDQCGFVEKHMSEELFAKIVSQAKAFQGQIKRVVFTGMGEPLANPQIAKMIKQLADAKIAQGYEIITNASLLTPKMSDALIEAGITYLRVSLQGLTSQKYQETTGTAVDFNALRSNIAYFYQHKKQCQVYVKMMDACFHENETEEQFYHLFGDICDKIYVENLIKAQPSMMNSYDENVTNEVTFYGEKAERRIVCPYPFYTLQIDAQGNTFPCPPLGFPVDFSLGNVNKRTLQDIWEKGSLRTLWMKHLEGKRSEIPYCNHCENYLCFTPKEDNLDEAAPIILHRIKDSQNEAQSKVCANRLISREEATTDGTN